jgi:uncharacterized membrane protein HdeD (DUF308 family)
MADQPAIGVLASRQTIRTAKRPIYAAEPSLTAWWLILGGVLSIAFGVVLIGWPNTGALALIWTLAGYAVFFGSMLIGLSFEIKKFQRS